MKFRLNSLLLAVILGALGARSTDDAALLYAQDATNAEAPAAAPAENPTPETPAPEASPAPAPTPAPAASPTPAATPAPVVLEMERAARAKTPEIFEKLKVAKPFSRRIPNYWNALKLTKRQKEAIYALQLEYFTEIVQLEARIQRLEAEREARYRDVLTPKQREALDAKLAEVEKTRAAKAEAKAAAEEAEAEAALQ